MRLATFRTTHAALAAVFTERSRRMWAATQAHALGHGGIGLVERATGISRATIQCGLRELDVVHNPTLGLSVHFCRLLQQLRDEWRLF